MKKGDKGGWIEGYHNLSQEDNCWIYDEAMVYGYARISDYAKVYDNTQVYDFVEVSDKAQVYGNSLIYGNAKIFHEAQISDCAVVYGYAIICNNAHICGNVFIIENVTIAGNAIIEKKLDYIVFKNSWSSGRCFTYTKSNKMWCVDNFIGTGDKLIKKAYQESELSGKMYEMYVNLVIEQEKVEQELSKS